MQIKIKRFDTGIPMPAYKTAGAAGLDLASRVNITIGPGMVERVPLNVAIELPAGHFAILAGRSSLYTRGLQMINGIGVMDHDFSGDNDEYQATLRNFTDVPVEIRAGDRLAQIVVLPYVRPTIVETASLDRPDRGGFGTTGI